jgi:hypothetical protein
MLFFTFFDKTLKTIFNIACFYNLKIYITMIKRFILILFLIPIKIFTQNNPASTEVIQALVEHLHSTVRLEFEYSNKTKEVGTGFFFDFPMDFPMDSSINLTCIVTNRHLLENVVKCKTKFTHKNEKDSTANYGLKSEVDLSSNIMNKIYHPNVMVDLGVIPIGFTNGKNYSTFIWKSFGIKHIPNDSTWNSLYPVESIKMIGYPLSLWDDYNNLPINLMGTTATWAKLPYRGQNEFLINISDLSGSSGAPIIRFNENRPNNEGKIPVSLLGINYQTETKSASAKASSELGDSEITVDVPVDIGYVIKSTELLKFIPIIKSKFKL